MKDYKNLPVPDRDQEETDAVLFITGLIVWAWVVAAILVLLGIGRTL